MQSDAKDGGQQVVLSVCSFYQDHSRASYMAKINKFALGSRVSFKSVVGTHRILPEVTCEFEVHNSTSTKASAKKEN